MTGHPKPRKTNDHDTDLVKSIQAGRRDLLPELIQRYERALYNFSIRMCGEPQDAEDVVQDTFLNVVKYLNGFRRETKFKNWLYRIATSVCIKKRRKSKFAPEHELSLDDFAPNHEAAVEQQVPQWAALPLAKVLNEELGKQLQEAMLDLPEKYRVVLALRDMEGFSTDETAQILSLTPSNVKVRLHRARLFMRDQLQTYFNDE